MGDGDLINLLVAVFGIIAAIIIGVIQINQSKK